MKKHLAPILLTAVCATPALACDLCSVFNVNAAEGTRNKGFSVSVAEQFTHFGTLQVDGRSVANPLHQYENSSVSQMVLGYTFADWASVQFGLPVIHREFRRPRPQGTVLRFPLTEHGTESGIGDASLLGVFTPVRVEHMHSTFNWSVFGGVKFPTGDSGRIAEELHEVETIGAPSGIHGHDLALGSGSYDGLVGTSVYGRYKRGFFKAAVQYPIRSSGAFDYHYANDLTWSGGPGVFLVLDERWTAAAQFVVSGEDKGLDRFRGQSARDTGITSVYAGPQVNATWKDKLSAEAGLDLPVLLNNTALQAVPDFRVRAAVTYRF